MSVEQIAVWAVLGYSLVHAFLNYSKVDLGKYLLNSKATPLRLTAASAIAGNVGAGTVIGIFNFAVNGRGIAFYISLCYALGLVLNGVLAGIVYRRSRELQADSLIDFITAHFGEDTKYYVWIAVGSIFFTQMAAQLLALSAVLESAMGFSHELSIFYAFAVVTLYLLSGGYYSVTRTDAVQFFFIFATAALVFIYNDWSFTLQHLERFVVIEHYSPVLVVGIFLFLAPAAFISIDNWHRVIASRSASTARKAFFITAGVCFFIYAAFSLLGIGPTAMEDKPVDVMRGLLPPGLSFFAVLALIMAVVSTMDSTILPLAAPICRTVKQRPLRAMRITVLSLMVGIALTAYALGDIITGIIAALSSLITLFPAVITALINGRPSALAVKISLPAAIFSSLIFVFVNEEYAFIVGIAVSFILFYSIRWWDLQRRDSAV